ncbi:MAG: c-type cytochrome [Planctomycetaceae bacterium]|nr:c-type cytochrome [Planctomycetaceae bacterium]
MTGLCVLVLTVGCGKNPEAQFAWRDSTLDLLPKAREGVETAVNDAFGTPHDLVAWDKLPVHFGGVQGVVQPPAEGEKLPANQFHVQWDGSPDGVGAGSELLWMTGAIAKSKHPTAVVVKYDDVTKTLELKSKGEAPAAGDRLAVGLGSQLQLGRMVYMKNCNHCHGVAGDGNGPTAQYLNPRPRDYRLGLFKFTSTLSSEKAAREDLDRIITYGIPGTYMPSFLLLGNNDGGKEKAAVVEYVRWLAMRGEMEKRLVDELSGDYSESGLVTEAEKEKKSYADAKSEYDKARKAGNKDAEKPEPAQALSQLKKAAGEELKKFLEEDFPGTINDTSDFIADAWKRADDPASLIVPTVARVTDDAASRERGRLLYMSDKAKCYTCHGAKGRGNGPAIEDFWKKPGSNDTYARRGLHDTWGNPLPPRDLTRGQYRGGRRPIDVFARVYAGIKGTPMPAFGGTVLKDSDIWDIVNYVMSLPFEEQIPSAKPAAAPHMAATEPVGQ